MKPHDHDTYAERIERSLARLGADEDHERERARRERARAARVAHDHIGPGEIEDRH